MIKPVVVTYDTDPANPGLARLVRTLENRGWHYEVLIDRGGWRGFGRRLKVAADRCRELSGTYSHAIHVDARDVVCTAPPVDFYPPHCPLLLATERGCWPDGDRAVNYPPCSHPWKFAHSQFVLDLKRVELLDCDGIEDWADDQRHLTDVYFKGNPEVQLDYRSDYVQSVAFCNPNFLDWFAIEGNRVRNRTTGSLPLFCHGNSRVDLNWLSPVTGCE